MKLGDSWLHSGASARDPAFMAEFVVAMHREVTPAQQDKLAKAGLRAAYTGRGAEAIATIIVPGDDADQARERITTLLSLSRDEATGLGVRSHRGDGWSERSS
jgi:hypothetical protein